MDEVPQSSLSDVFAEIRYADAGAFLHYSLRGFRGAGSAAA